MASIKVANFAFIYTGNFTLPGLQTTAGQHTHIRGTETMYFDLPDDARDKGMLSFYWDTNKGADDGIDLKFEVTVNSGSKYSWSYHSDEAGCFQLPVFNLKHGQNYVIFETTKAGKRTEPDPDEYLGGKGVVNFGQVCLTYHRDVAL
jgi:hypothetical protein